MGDFEHARHLQELVLALVEAMLFSNRARTS